MVRNNQLSLFQELVCYAHAFAQQPTGILPQIEDEPLHVTHFLKSLRHLTLGSFLEPRDMHVPDAGLDHEMQVHAIPRNFVANHCELERMIRPLAQNGNPDRRPFWTLEQVRDVGGTHVVGRLAIHRSDDVARMNAGTIRRCPSKRRDHDHFVIARADRHAHTVVFAALLFAQQGIGLRIKEVRMRIERMQHTRDRAVINGLVRAHRFGVVFFHHFINLCELFVAVPNLGITARRGRGADLLREDHTQQAEHSKDKNYQEE